MIDYVYSIASSGVLRSPYFCVETWTQYQLTGAKVRQVGNHIFEGEHTYSSNLASQPSPLPNV